MGICLSAVASTADEAALYELRAHAGKAIDEVQAQWCIQACYNVYLEADTEYDPLSQCPMGHARSEGRPGAPASHMEGVNVRMDELSLQGLQDLQGCPPKPRSRSLAAHRAPPLHPPRGLGRQPGQVCSCATCGRRPRQPGHPHPAGCRPASRTHRVRSY